MASARFRIGTATTNSAGTTWSWRAYDTAADVSSGSYVKVELESTNGVRTLTVSLPTADEQTLSAGVPTVTTVQSSKTATFQAGTGSARTYVIRAVINSTRDLNGDIVSGYTKELAAHIKTAGGRRLLAVGESDQADRTYGWVPKVNSAIKVTAGALGSSGVAAGTYGLSTVTISSTGVITSAASGSITLSSSGVTGGTYTNPTLVISSTGVITSAATGSALTAVDLGTVLYVDSEDGTSGGTRGDLSKTYDTITRALGDAATGDIVMVGPGTYAENLTIPNIASLTIKGAGRVSKIVGTGATTITRVSSSALTRLEIADLWITNTSTAGIPINLDGTNVSTAGYAVGSGMVELRNLFVEPASAGVDAMAINCVGRLYVQDVRAKGVVDLDDIGEARLRNLDQYNVSTSVLSVKYGTTEPAGYSACDLDLFSCKPGDITVTGVVNAVFDASTHNEQNDFVWNGSTGATLFDVSSNYGNVTVLGDSDTIQLWDTWVGEFINVTSDLAMRAGGIRGDYQVSNATMALFDTYFSPAAGDFNGSGSVVWKSARGTSSTYPEV